VEFGTRHLVAESEALAADTAGRRDFLANTLRERGLPSQAIEVALRHFSDGISPWQAASTVSAFRLCEAASQTIDAIAREIDVLPLAGISRSL
jgi:hypothetical protein